MGSSAVAGGESGQAFGVTAAQVEKKEKDFLAQECSLRFPIGDEHQEWSKEAQNADDD